MAPLSVESPVIIWSLLASRSSSLAVIWSVRSMAFSNWGLVVSMRSLRLAVSSRTLATVSRRFSVSDAARALGVELVESVLQAGQGLGHGLLQHDRVLAGRPWRPPR